MILCHPAVIENTSSYTDLLDHPFAVSSSPNPPPDCDFEKLSLNKPDFGGSDEEIDSVTFNNNIVDETSFELHNKENMNFDEAYVLKALYSFENQKKNYRLFFNDSSWCKSSNIFKNGKHCLSPVLEVEEEDLILTSRTDDEKSIIIEEGLKNEDVTCFYRSPQINFNFDEIDKNISPLSLKNENNLPDKSVPSVSLNQDSENIPNKINSPSKLFRESKTQLSEVNDKADLPSLHNEFSDDNLNEFDQIQEFPLKEKKLVSENNSESFLCMCKSMTAEEWKVRVSALRQSEAVLKKRQLLIEEREYEIARKERRALAMERDAKNHLIRAQIYLRHSKSGQNNQNLPNIFSLNSKNLPKRISTPSEMNSTVTADISECHQTTTAVPKHDTRQNPFLKMREKRINSSSQDENHMLLPLFPGKNYSNFFRSHTLDNPKSRKKRGDVFTLVKDWENNEHVESLSKLQKRDSSHEKVKSKLEKSSNKKITHCPIELKNISVKEQEKSSNASSTRPKSNNFFSAFQKLTGRNKYNKTCIDQPKDSKKLENQIESIPPCNKENIIKTNKETRKSHARLKRSKSVPRSQVLKDNNFYFNSREECKNTPLIHYL